MRNDPVSLLMGPGRPRRESLLNQRFPLRLEELEDRTAPALTIQLDYSFDTSGFFNDPARRRVLEAAVNEVAARIDSSLGAILPSPGNSWTASFIHPSTGQMQTITNLVVPADTLIVFVGARDLPGVEAGTGGFGGWSATGSSTWLSEISTRGTGQAMPWGGSLAFDNRGTDWSFSLTSVTSQGVDFYSVAQHELGHLLGLGTSSRWFDQVAGNAFHGPWAKGVYGGPVPLQSGGLHWADGVNGFGCHCPSCVGVSAVSAQASLTPTLPTGRRVGFSELDFAALRDIGWQVRSPVAPGASSGSSSSASRPSASPPAVPLLPPLSAPPPPAPVFTPTPAARPGDRVAISGGAGSVQVFQQASDGLLRPISPVLRPFSGYNGVIRSAIGDFNGDGVADLAVTTASGPAASVMLYNGKDFSVLLGGTVLWDGFRGGAFLAAGDVNRDGRDELAVSADAGGSPRVTVLEFRNGRLQVLSDFFAFDDPNFRGGARVALGDVNRDGFADLVVTAGPGGGPRVSTYDGRSLTRGWHDRLIWDFFAFDSRLRTGAYVAAGDLNGDGYAEIIFSADDGGSSRTIAYSGWLLSTRPGVDPMTLPLLFSQFATLENSPRGTRVTVKDLDGDGRNEMIFTTAARTDSTLRIITADQILTPVQPVAQVQQPIGLAADPAGLFLG